MQADFYVSLNVLYIVITSLTTLRVRNGENDGDLEANWHTLSTRLLEIVSNTMAVIIFYVIIGCIMHIIVYYYRSL